LRITYEEAKAKWERNKNSRLCKVLFTDFDDFWDTCQDVNKMPQEKLDKMLIDMAVNYSFNSPPKNP
jgi:hypothetical protein